MVNLIRNEHMKIYRRPRTWILAALLLAVICAASLLAHRSGPSEDWRTAIGQSLEENRHMLQDPALQDGYKAELARTIAIQEYALRHEVPPVEATLWGGVQMLAEAVQLITLFTVIIAGDMVAGEFTWGTIKLLLIRPASRSKILLSKYVATLLFAVFFLLLLLLGALVVNGFIYGFQYAGAPYLRAEADGAIRESSMLLHMLGIYALKLVELVMVVTLAFMISTVFRSASLAIGISIFTMFAGQVIGMLLLRFDWGKYVLFANTDLTPYLQGRAPAEGMTAGFSVMVLLFYFLVFNVLSWELFRRRDIVA